MGDFPGQLSNFYPMSNSPSTYRTTVRFVEAIAERITQDPAAQVNISAFVRVVLDRFISAAAPIETTRTLGIRLNSKTAERPLCLSFPKELGRHYARYAKAAGNHSFGALVASALALHYFGPAATVAQFPVQATEAKPKGWRNTLQALAIGQTVEFTRSDLTTTIGRARKTVFATAECIRDAVPEFRVTTRKTPRVLYVTRAA